VLENEIIQMIKMNFASLVLRRVENFLTFIATSERKESRRTLRSKIKDNNRDNSLLKICNEMISKYKGAENNISYPPQ